MDVPSKDELACIYSAAILADDDVPITAEKMSTLINAAGLNVESVWPTLFARALQGMNIRELITNASAAIAGAAPAGGGVTGAAAGADVKEEEKAEEKADTEDSDDDDMGFGLFDD